MKPMYAIAACGILSILSTNALSAGRARQAAAGSATGMSSSRTTTAQSSTTMRGPSRTGQPNQTCGSASAPNTPGNAADASGSAFNPDGHAGTVYAGQHPQNSRNTASVSQYDVACSHQPH